MALSEEINYYDMKLPADLSIKNFGSRVAYLRHALPGWAQRAKQLETEVEKLRKALDTAEIMDFGRGIDWEIIHALRSGE
jgi:hypothetical protein